MTKLIFKFSIIVLFLAACTEKKVSQNTASSTEVTDTVPVFILGSSDVSKSIELSAELLPNETAGLTAKGEYES